MHSRIPRQSTRSAPLFSFEVQSLASGGSELRATGELDLAAVRVLDALLVTGESVGGVVRLDLTGVTFLDCSCLRVLMLAQQRLRSAGEDLELDPVSHVVSRLLHLAGLDASMLGAGASTTQLRLAPTSTDPPSRATRAVPVARTDRPGALAPVPPLLRSAATSRGADA